MKMDDSNFGGGLSLGDHRKVIGCIGWAGV